MIKAISFDLYNTLVQFWPPLEEVQQAACRELGLNVCKASIRRAHSRTVHFNSGRLGKLRRGPAHALTYLSVTRLRPDFNERKLREFAGRLQDKGTEE